MDPKLIVTDETPNGLREQIYEFLQQLHKFESLLNKDDVEHLMNSSERVMARRALSETCINDAYLKNRKPYDTIIDMKHEKCQLIIENFKMFEQRITFLEDKVLQIMEILRKPKFHRRYPNKFKLDYNSINQHVGRSLEKRRANDDGNGKQTLVEPPQSESNQDDSTTESNSAAPNMSLENIPENSLNECKNVDKLTAKNEQTENKEPPSDENNVIKFRKLRNHYYNMTFFKKSEHSLLLNHLVPVKSFIRKRQTITDPKLPVFINEDVYD